METVAMYWEPQIKTYGFQVKKNLALYQCTVPANRLSQWDRAAGRMKDGKNRFHLLSAQLSAPSEFSLLLLCDPEQGVSMASQMEMEMPVAMGRVTLPVELLFFQGPHFGDRFGIADFTCRALGEHADLLLATAFSCASIYLIFPECAADKAKTLLTAAFRIPR